MKQDQLDTRHHDRDSAGLAYVYPVVSRRAHGVSIGINLNINNACNWRCIYCQVPNLSRGGPPPVDMTQLESELRQMLTDIVQGDYMARHVPEGMRRLNDIALSGNGEPTSAPEFPQVIELVGKLMAEFGLSGRIKLVLISNGSLMHRPTVQAGLRHMASLGGEVWFKLDSYTAEGIRQTNNSELPPEKVYRNLVISCGLCPTWLQTCVFALDGQPPSEPELLAYLDLLRRLKTEAVPLGGVLLYGLARPSMQPEAPRLSALPGEWLERFATRIRGLGITVQVAV
jgi:wyosine [tRNA(Phe)-imidazoG37] synthetase (radical SAM superfamily)